LREYERRTNFLSLCSSKAGIHNIHPAGQIWPADAFNVAHSALILVLLPCFIKATPFEAVKTYNFLPLNVVKRQTLSARHKI